MARTHGPVRVRGIREVNVSHRDVAGTVLTSLVGATVDSVLAENGVRCTLSGRVETSVIGGQSRRLPPFVDRGSIRIDGMHSRLPLWPGWHRMLHSSYEP
jgi:hypothetical protein